MNYMNHIQKQFVKEFGINFLINLPPIYRLQLYRSFLKLRHAIYIALI